MNSTKTAESALRGLGVCCAVGNVVLHGLLVPDHLEEKFYVGILFAVGSVVVLVVAVGLVVAKRPLVAWLTGSLVSLGVIIGFVLSRTVGLPDGYYEPGWESPYGPLSLLVEGLFVLAFLAWLGGGTANGTALRGEYVPDHERITPAQGSSKRR
ncbi:hypothetical protein [Streptomyces mirabilis]|uniref:hypothetical protein n=1 Tax=Streptomyces mirabilis TaxID=68239 RepID=UPI00225BC70A|nr:hypothetical protein [Streptomyces mirabilis]MCX4420302.1 hypothetical protein [Streptomyces mirabilis]